jgi:YtkA-like
MTRKIILAGVAMAAALSVNVAAFAGANDYTFEPVKTEIGKGHDVIVSVRLKHKATGKPVTDAVIVQSRIDMAPDGMAEMASPLTPVRAMSPVSIRSRPNWRCKAAGCSASPQRCKESQKR